MFRIIIKPKAEKQLQKLPHRDQERITQSIDLMAEDPFRGKKLQGELVSLYTMRVWPYRILYTIEKKILTVFVVAIGHRKDVYR
jgi:mRNA interferase RelE/StbE